MATRRGGPVHAPYQGGGGRGKMLTALPAGYRMVPVVVERSAPATRSRPTKLPPNPPMDLYEIEAGKRYRRHVARALAGKTDRFGPPAVPVTRVGIAVDAGLRMRQAVEQHAFAVARRLGLR